MIALVAVVGGALTISFGCSILEAVLLSTTHSYVAVLRDRGERAGVLLTRMREHIDRPIAAILTLNTIGNTLGAAVGGALAIRVFGNAWIALFSVGLTFAVLIFSEIVPKTIGARYWRQLAKPAAYVLTVLMILMKPVLVPLALINRLLTPQVGKHPRVSRAELEILAEIGRREGEIDQEEWQVVSNVINLDRVKVGQVMTPRTAMVAIGVEASLEEAQQVMLDEGRLRIPVYEKTVDGVVGILLARDLWRAHRDGATALREVMRPARFVPATKPVEDLLSEMRSERIKMAIVLDEFGGTAGLVTLEDLIEEIVGEIHDEHEEDPLPFEETPDGLRIEGDVTVHEVNERCELRLPEDTHDTIGGYVFGMLGRVATVGDEIAVEGGIFRVSAVDGRRVRRVTFSPAPSAEEAAQA